jgi:glycosyltransferase involved in cell wall biosynthesis
LAVSYPKLLVVLPQLPQDPASGAARSTRTIAEMLGSAGFEVHVVATTATESADRFSALPFLAAMGIEANVQRSHGKARSRPEVTFDHRQVRYRLLDVGPRDMNGWQQIHSRQFDLMFDDELYTFRPDVLFGFGGHACDVQRYARAKRQGVKLVFALHNEGYLSSADFFAPMDAILTPSQHLTTRYRAQLAIDSTPLPIPIEPEDVLAEDREPIFATMINPSREKGLMFAARLAEELSLRRPDIAMLFIESRGSAGRVVQAGLVGGFDLRRHENLMLSPPVSQPKEIYAATRVLLAPSLWLEPAGRVAAEALLNGIPPMVSDRGGLPEVCNGAGFTLPIPAEITPRLARPVDREVVLPWVDLIARLEDDEAFYQEQSDRARQAGQIYHPERLKERYVEFFRHVVDRSD